MPRARNPVPTRRTTMDLPETLVKRLDLYVGVTERTRVNIMTEALEEYLDRQENAARAMMAKARPSWE